MKLSEHVRDLALTTTTPNGEPMTLHLSLILDPVQGLTLVDTGLPGMMEALRAALQEEGFMVSDIRRVLVTHHDLDHVGLLPDVVGESGAEVWASPGELPFVQGERSPQKQPSRPAMQTLKAIRVGRILHDDEQLDLAGGVRVVATPGHTVGHLSFLVEQDGVLISGDALTSASGVLHLPVEQYTADVPLALTSVRKLAGLPITGIHTYHGGYVGERAAAQLRDLLLPAR